MKNVLTSHLKTSASFLYEVAGRVKNCHFGHYLFTIIYASPRRLQRARPGRPAGAGEDGLLRDVAQPHEPHVRPRRPHADVRRRKRRAARTAPTHLLGTRSVGANTTALFLYNYICFYLYLLIFICVFYFYLFFIFNASVNTA